MIFKIKSSKINERINLYLQQTFIMKVGEVIVKKLTNLVFKYKIYPVLMYREHFLSITVVIQNISIARF